MVNQSNLQSVVQQLLAHLVRDSPSVLPSAVESLVQNTTTATRSSLNALPSPSQSPAYRLTLAQRILSMGSQSTYENVSNFDWYLSVLVDLAHVANVNVGAEIRDQLVDIVGRVRATRPYAVKLMYSLICDDILLRNASEDGSCSEILWAAAWICGEYCQELSEPQNILPYLLQPGTNKLSPDSLAMYIQAAVKIFGFWVEDLATRWADDRLPEVKQGVESILTRLKELAGSQHIEVQERAANALQLFTFISADLHSYRPNMQLVSPMPTPGPSSGFETSVPSDEPRFPKSLYLIQPLFSAYELNPVAAKAQASVPVPEGLDLDAWIVSPPREALPAQAEDRDETSAKKKKRTKKGKEKEASSATRGKKKELIGNGNGTLETLTPLESDHEAPEEKEKRKAERLAQLRDDPYYIIDDKPAKVVEDIDLIPVVHLDDMPPIPSDTRLPSLRATSQAFSSQSFVIERDGEMPFGSALSPSHLETQATSLARPSSQSSIRSRPTSVQQYEVPDDSPKPQTPEPIKVIRTKKKTTGKKKRTVPAEAA
ncbi:unnamed protein product [Cyclocybe aegerita]|uniref:Clathrin/coatomer adaptor adaptin-like N-terminal domain-containing protein n=1 Tax=Cyclocybe aegerita TaxID=1973307 RepID=A0A8S0W9W0_CYCAE|nr:unnamed protein product [Cyclocybe aegerita]